MDYIKNTYAEIYIEDGILYFKYLPFENFDIEAAKKIVSQRLKLQKEVPFPVLCDIRQLTLPDIKARRYLAVEGSMLAKAVATESEANFISVRASNPNRGIYR